VSRGRRPGVITALALFTTVATAALALTFSLPVSADLWSEGAKPAAPSASVQPNPSTQPAALSASQSPKRSDVGAEPEATPTRLGGIGPLTGPRAKVGAILRVAQAVVARSGAGEVVVKDDGSAPLRTIPAARFLENYHRVQAFLSPLETYPVASLFPYLGYTKTPTLFLSTTVSRWATGPHVVGFPPAGSGATQVLAQSMQRAVDERVRTRGGEPPGQGVWVIWVDTEDGRDRIAGVRKAGLTGVTEVSVQPESKAVPMPGTIAPEAALIIGAPKRVAEVAAAVLALPAGCTGGEAMSACAPPPAIFAAVFEPYDWAELASVPGLAVADWLQTDAATLAWHRAVLQQVLHGERPSRLTLWGHALGEVTNEVLRRAGPNADGAGLLGAARSLRSWQSRLLPAITLDANDQWPIEHVAIVSLTRGQPTARSAWIPVPRP
jgi:hypothetical protein